MGFDMSRQNKQRNKKKARQEQTGKGKKK